MTNGEKLQEIFPNADIDWSRHPDSDILVHFDTKETNPKTCAWFTHRWWNEEYTGPAVQNNSAQERYQDLTDYFIDE